MALGQIVCAGSYEHNFGRKSDAHSLLYPKMLNVRLNHLHLLNMRALITALSPRKEESSIYRLLLNGHPPTDAFRHSHF